MTRYDFEKTLTNISSVDLSKLGSIHPSMANTKETFYIKDERYRFKIESGKLLFDCGVEMPDVALDEELDNDYIERFCETVKEIGMYAKSGKCITDIVAGEVPKNEKERQKVMAEAYFFRILLTFVFDNLEKTVTERRLNAAN